MPYSDPRLPLVPPSSSVVHQRAWVDRRRPQPPQLKFHSIRTPEACSRSPYPPAHEMKVRFQQPPHSRRVSTASPHTLTHRERRRFLRSNGPNGASFNSRLQGTEDGEIRGKYRPRALAQHVRFMPFNSQPRAIPLPTPWSREPSMLVGAVPAGLMKDLTKVESRSSAECDPSGCSSNNLTTAVH